MDVELELPGALVATLKAVAAALGRTVDSVLTEAVEEYLHREAQISHPPAGTCD
jgi:predicted transcriptional regulator